jgi:alanine racemase
VRAGTIDLAGIRATRAIIDLDAIADNVSALRRQLLPECELMGVVKADAYGHGAPWVARTALDAGCSLLGVATVGEGTTLRAHGIACRIILLGSLGEEQALSACRAGLEITVAGFELLAAVQRAVGESGVYEPIPVHLKVDSGLRRFGAMTDVAVALAQRIVADPKLRLVGVCSHFASADELDEPFTDEQFAVFNRTLDSMQGAKIPIPARHVANSAAILTGMCVDLEVARAGIAMYGIPPSPQVGLLPGMRPAMRIESRVARLVPLMPGDTVGYNRTFRASRPMQGALVPIGYADGYRRSLSNHGWMGLAGSRADVLGRVSMDQTVVAIPDGASVAVGDAVHILGHADDGAPTALDLAELMDTNGYEVLVGIRKRVPRVFLRAGSVVAVRQDGDGDSV